MGASRAAVQEKLRAYNEALKKARSGLFVEQEAARRLVLDERQALVSAARVAAQKELQNAKMAIASEIEAARIELEQSSGALASEIADSILAGRSSGPSAPQSGGAR